MARFSCKKFAVSSLFALTFLATAVHAAAPGTANWSYYLSYGAGLSSPAIGNDGSLYVGSIVNQVTAVNPNGTLKWYYPTGGRVDSSAAIGPDGTIYIGAADQKLYALNPDGTLQWTYLTGGVIETAPAIGTDGRIYVYAKDGVLYAINRNGTLGWTYAAAGGMWSPAIGLDGAIYVGADGGLRAVNPDGSRRWTYSIGSGASSPAVGSDGTVYCTAQSGLYAVNPNGTRKWKYTPPSGNTYWALPAIGQDGTVYVGSDDGTLYAVNADGTLKWSYATGGRIKTSCPAVGSDGVVYVGSENGYFYAINPDGSLQWSHQTGWVSTSPVIGTDGTVYVSSFTHYLYALNSSSAGLADSPWPMFHHDAKHTGRAVETEPRLAVRLSGSGTGSVASNPPGINCGTACSAVYDKETGVTLTATPDTGMIFAGWSGEGCTGTGECTVTMSGDRTVTAVFTAHPLDDLVGTWNVHTLASGPSEPWWYRARISVDAVGSFSGTGEAYGGSPQPVSGFFTQSADGGIVLYVDNSASCRMDGDKTVMVCTETWNDGTTGLIVLEREASSYSLADLTGRWHVSGLAAGASDPYWMRGGVTVEMDGTFTKSIVDSAGGTDNGSDTFSISPQGLITQQGKPNAKGNMDEGKTVFTLTDTWSDGTAFFMMAVKKGGSYSTADLEGLWDARTLASGAGAPWWERATIIIGADGTFTGLAEDSESESYGKSGQFSLSGDGVVTLGSLTCYMDSGKTIFVCTDTWSSGAPGTSEMKIFTKRPPGIVADFNADGKVDLADALLCLRVMVGLSPSVLQMRPDADGGGNISAADVIYILQKTSELR